MNSSNLKQQAKRNNGKYDMINLCKNKSMRKFVSCFPLLRFVLVQIRQTIGRISESILNIKLY